MSHHHPSHDRGHFSKCVSSFRFDNFKSQVWMGGHREKGPIKFLRQNQNQIQSCKLSKKNDWISSTGESSDRLSITLHKGLKDRFYVNLLFWRSNFRFYLEIGINPLTLVKQKVYSINYWLFWLFYLFTKKIILIKPEVTSLFLLTPGYYNRFKTEIIWLFRKLFLW